MDIPDVLQLDRSEVADTLVQAKEAYQKALDLEPDDIHLRASYDKADIQERKVVEARRHKFKGKSFGVGAAPTVKRERAEVGKGKGLENTKQPVEKRAKAGKGPLLSFADDDEDN